jgi:hypothetical protein
MYRNNFPHQGTGDFQYRSVATERECALMTMRITCHTLLAFNIHEMAQKISVRVRPAPEDIRREGFRPGKRPNLVDGPGSTEAAPQAPAENKAKVVESCMNTGTSAVRVASVLQL